MRFRVNDLGIDVATEAEAQQPAGQFCNTTCSFTPSRICGPPSLCQTTCSHTPSNCGIVTHCNTTCSFSPSINCGIHTHCATTCSTTPSIHCSPPTFCVTTCSTTPSICHVSHCATTCTFTHSGCGPSICATTCSFTASIHICQGQPTVCACSAIASIPAPVGPGDPVELAALRAQLEQQLAQVKEQEQAAADAMQPQTVEQVDMLQAKLQEAMTALDARRAALQQQPPSGPDAAGTAGTAGS
jgi:hypothetical protein